MIRFPAAVQSLRTVRLILTPLRVEDAAEMAGVLADPALYDVIGGSPPDAVTLRRRYKKLVVGRSRDGSQQWLNWVIRLRPGVGHEEDHPETPAVGTVQATVMAGGAAAEIAWIVGTAWQGRGYAGEAAAAMADLLRAAGVQLLVAHIHPRHAASQGVARRAGLTPTPELHDAEQRWASTSMPPGPP
ncbi:MAG: GNAT family N-acetyltransferase [Tetrasphaera sp.]|nr:GNAT family N-acetyltransferase [Tetrasphaera sp.]